ncbi:hypothetical protein Anas_10542 [Armadillidium nasatum]|uniref:Mitochondrial sodium/hydrogen exchanger 9B2 n=1 Tax=Armadillidium nasatum TaxID=96803 RepID=A0A5N5SLT9_9CRUS|nr:hypothetical protein Anas_10542 [Armadillidium nasatum]
MLVKGISAKADPRCCLATKDSLDLGVTRINTSMGCHYLGHWSHFQVWRLFPRCPRQPLKFEKRKYSLPFRGCQKLPSRYAAFGSVALDIAREANTDESVETLEEMLGSKVLTLAVMAIVIAAPIGAIAIMTSAPKLLKYTPSEEEQNNAAFEDTENKEIEGNPT